jgi:hypothetical protein
MVLTVLKEVENYRTSLVHELEKWFILQADIEPNTCLTENI